MTEPKTWTCIARSCSGVEHPWVDWTTASHEMGQHARDGKHDTRWPVTFRLGPVAPGAVPEVTYFDPLGYAPSTGRP